MNAPFKLLKPLFFCLLLLSACNKKESIDVDWTPTEAATQLETGFKAEAGPIEDHVKSAVSSLQSGEYEKAFVSLQVIEGKPNLTYEQALTVRRSIQSMQKELADALLAGDPKAEALVKKIRGY